MKMKLTKSDLTTICIRDIPEWQKKDSEFFNNLTKGIKTENDKITIDSRLIREDDTICNIEDFIIVYEISTFFRLKNPSDGLLIYIMTLMDDETYNILKNKYNPYRDVSHSGDQRSISLWWDIFDIVHYTGELNKLSASLLFTKKGNIPMIKFYVRNGVPVSYYHCIEASRSNKICLEYCFSFFTRENHIENNISECFENAIKKKKIDCLQFLFELFPNAIEYENANQFSYYACEVDNLDALIFLHQNGFPWDETTCIYASGFLRCLKYLIDNGCPCDFIELMYCCKTSCYNYVMEKYREQYGIQL